MLGRNGSKISVNVEPIEQTFEKAIRLDPQALPHRYKYRTGLEGDAAEAAVLLDRTMATVCRRLPSGIPMAMRMTMHAFEGVAVRFAPGDDGDSMKVVLELLHRDPNLSLPLAVVDDMDDVVADWRSWGRALSLPLLVVEADGSYRPVEARLGAVDIRPTRPRRRRSILAQRRPRFLVRRRVPVIPEVPTFVAGREITAWE